MTDAVTRARELLAEATPGPWACGDYAIAYPQGGVGSFWEVTTSDYDDTISCQIDSRDDAELIAAAPTLLAELADEVERLRARLDAVVAIHSDRDGDCAECEMSTGQGVDWPCWTYEAALGVES